MGDDILSTIGRMRPHKRFKQDRSLSEYNEWFSDIAGCNLEDYIVNGIRAKGSFEYVDACCGYGVALHELSSLLDTKGYSGKFNIIGVDILTDVDPAQNTLKYGPANYDFVCSDILDVSLSSKADLITCIGGIIYQDHKNRGQNPTKLKAIENLFSQVDFGGIFAFGDHGRYDLDTLYGISEVDELRIYTKIRDHDHITYTFNKIVLVKKRITI